MKKLKFTSLLLPILLLVTVAAVRPLLRPAKGLSAQNGQWLNGPTVLGLLRIHAIDSLPDVNGHYFVTSGICENCHGHDPNGIGLVDAMGRDINMADDWKSTMMANAAKDPFWRAQVSHEVLTNPSLQTVTEDKCLQCHAPLGRYSHLFESQGQADYSMAMLANDTLGLDGVSCMSCHSQRVDSLGQFFSGKLILDSARTVYGPFPGPVVAPMFTANHLVVGYGPHVQESRLCAACHTLMTQTVDLQGSVTSNWFAEQATYHEWVNSNYANLDLNCQTCHMPVVNDFVYLSYPHISSTMPRRPIYKHHFAGSNTFMLRMLKNYADSLGIEADAVNFDSTIARTNDLLRHQSLDMELRQMARGTDSVMYDLKLINRVGHKFPSGYPSRRIFVEFVLRNANGDTLFQSGTLGSNYEVRGQDPGYEPHHDMINQEDQAQIYEFIMADVAGNVTTTLERAATHLKDNRLVPQGFMSNHPNWDTTEIAGSALNDPDFNHDGTTEGTGTDIVHYHIPLAGYTGALQVSARVWYQTVRPGWLDEMFAHSSPDIDRFQRWYNGSDRSVVLVGELLTTDVIIGATQPMEPSVLVYPNPTQDGWVRLMLPQGLDGATLRVYDLQGRLLSKPVLLQDAVHKLQLPDASGSYLIDLQGTGWRKTIKVLRR